MALLHVALLEFFLPSAAAVVIPGAVIAADEQLNWSNTDSWRVTVMLITTGSKFRQMTFFCHH